MVNAQIGKNVRDFLPEWLDYGTEEPLLVGVEAVHVLEDEGSGHFEAHLLLESCLLVELIGQKR